MKVAAKRGGQAKQSPIVDITAWRGTQKKLKELEQKHRAIFENTGTAIVIVEQDTTISLVNAEFEKLTGYTKKEIEGKKSWKELVDKSCLQGMQEYHRLRRIDPKLAPRSYEFKLIDKAGNAKNILITIGMIPGTKKSACSLIDIAERKRAEEALKESEQKYRLLAENITDVVFIQDMDLNVTYVSPSVTQLFGYTIEEVLKLRMKDFMTWESFRKAMDSFQGKATLAHEKEDVDIPLMEYEYVRKDGSTFWGEIKVSFLRDSKGRPVGSQGVLRDITRRKQAEQLMRALNKTATAMEHAMTPQEIFITVAEQLTRLGFYCAVLPTDKSRKKLYPEYLSYNAEIIQTVEGLVKLKAEDFSIPIESVDVFKEVVWQRETVFVENAEEVLRQSLPRGTKKLVKQVANMLKVQKFIATPLILDGDVIALFSVQSDGLTRDEVPTINAFANQISAALRKANLLQDLQKSLAEQKRAKEELQDSLGKLRASLESTVHALASTLEMRDPYTAGHQRRVTDLACAIAKAMGLPKKQIEGLRVAAIIHDIGKINIPSEILSKPGRLTELQFEMIKSHPQAGCEILKGIEFPGPVAQIVLQHHERMNGTGYPQGLSGNEILLEARILGVADVVEAMVSHRPYRHALSIDDALEEITKNRGVLYDPKVVDVCLSLFNEKGFTFE